MDIFCKIIYSPTLEKYHYMPKREMSDIPGNEAHTGKWVGYREINARSKKRELPYFYCFCMCM